MMRRAALLAAALVVAGCGGRQAEPKAADVAACLDEGIGEMLTSRSCVEALQALQRVVRSYPQCAAALTPAGSEATALTLGAVTLICDGWQPPDGGS